MDVFGKEELSEMLSNEEFQQYLWDYYVGKTVYEFKYGPGMIFSGEVELFDINYFEPMSSKSTAGQLRNTVSKWYIALRNFSLVGLLSVLVYLGIQIILNSSSVEKQAKYKNLIRDWLVAICILFFLQYIMIFAIKINDKIVEVFSGDMSLDKLGSTIRNNAEIGYYNSQSLTRFSYVIIYIIWVVQTAIFTVYYLKRTVRIAFLTMIAPLIALTYPIDKVKDGQAQAFSTWIKEYVFNILIQVIHIVLYTVLVTSAIDLATKVPIYGIVAIAYLIPAEKFFKKLFGFGKAESVGQLGAAAGGALVMNAINKMKSTHSGGNSGGSSGSGGKTPIRTRGSGADPTLDPSQLSGGILGSGGSGSGGSGSGGSGSGGSGSGGSGSGGSGSGGSGSGGSGSGGSGSGGSGSGGSGSGGSGSGGSRSGGSGSGRSGSGGSGSGRSSRAIRNRPRGAVGRGLSNVWHGKIMKGRTGGQFVGDMAKGLIKGTIGAGLGIATGAIGLGVGAATGELDNAFKYMGAGAAAGGHFGSALTGKAMSGLEGISEAYKEGYYGQEEYNNMRADKEFFASQEYRDLRNNNALWAGMSKSDIKSMVKQYRENGIVDTSKIEKARKNNLNPQQARTYSEIAKHCPESILHDRRKFRNYLSNNGYISPAFSPAQISTIMNTMYNNIKIFK